MKKVGEEYMDGNILAPQEGKVYRCKPWLDGTNLMVRGYWGPSIGPRHGGNQLDYMYSIGKISKLRTPCGLLSQ